MKPFWFFVFLSALTVTGQPVINKITIPAGMILKNREAIHFTGKIEPQLLVLVSGLQEGPVSNWKFEARVEGFPYTPDLFQLRRVKTGYNIGFVDGAIKKIDVLTEEMVLKRQPHFQRSLPIITPN